MSQFEIRQGDCLELLRGMEPESVDAIVTDPPYGIAYQSEWSEKAIRKAPIANDERPFVWWMADAFRVARPGAGVACFCRWDVQEPFRLALGWAGFEVRSQVIWDREHTGMGNLKASFAPQHDVIWFATKGAFQFTEYRPPSVLRVPRLSGAALQHPNEKPVALMAALVRSLSAPGQLVLDPFAGSGATGVACSQLGRRFLGMELDPKYADLARRRIAGPLFAEATP